MNKKIIASLLAASVAASLLSVVSFADPDGTTPLTVPKAYKVPTIDGHFDENEGWGEPVAHLTRADQAEDAGFAVKAQSLEISEMEEDTFCDDIKVYYRWDETNVYFCGVIVEPVQENEAVDSGNVWAGDGFQFDMATDPDRTTRTTFFLGLNSDDGTSMVAVNRLEDDTDWDDEWANGTYVFTRDEATKTTVYEAAFPWATSIANTWKASIGAQIQLRCIVLCNPGDILDINVPGIVDGSYLYYFVTLGDYADADVAQFAETEAPAPEPAPAEAAPAEPAASAAETAAPAVAPAETAAPAAETAAPAPAAAPAAPAAAAQTGDAAAIVILAAAAALGTAVVVGKKH